MEGNLYARVQVSSLDSVYIWMTIKLCNIIVIIIPTEAVEAN